MADVASLFLPIAWAGAKPPDVTVPFRIPGGQLTPLTPNDGSQTVRRNQYLIPFNVQQGCRVVVKQLAVTLPVILKELEAVVTTLTDVTYKVFKTEAEAVEHQQGAGGIIEEAVKKIPMGYAAHGEEIKQEEARVQTKVNNSRDTLIEKTTRSVLPVTITVALRIYGPNGLLWSTSQELEIHFVFIEGFGLGTAVGVGLLESYADLTNALELDPSAGPYGLGLAVLVPTSVPTEVAAGLERIAGESVAGKGGVTLLYDVVPAPLGK
jgi:hypothetical protein